MVFKQKQKTILPNLTVGRRVGTPTTGAALSTRPLVTQRITLSGFVVSMAAADDFGGTKLLDLINADLVIVSAVLNLAVVVAGLAVNTAAALDVALGTVTTASAAFSNAGEKDVVPKIDGVGATATGTVIGQGTTTEALKAIAAGASNALFLNASSAVTTGTGTATFTGTIDLIMVDPTGP